MNKLQLFSQILLSFLSIHLAIAGNSAMPNFQNHISDKGIKQWLVAKKAAGIKTVVIDAGHGGKDPGCLGSNAREKHITLNIALQLADNLRKKHPDINVVLTRDSDIFIPLHERAAIANRNNADLFISIHCNFMPGSSATAGTETYVMGLHTAEYNLQVAKRENESILLEDNFEQNYDFDPNSPEGHIFLSMYQNTYLDQSIQFADLVEEAIHKQLQRKSRGVKQAGFMVLKATAMPSVLIETGFLSNPAEEAYLNTALGQEQIAFAIAQAFTTYKATIEDSPLASTPIEPALPRPMLVANPTPITANPAPIPPAPISTNAEGNAPPVNVNMPPKSRVSIASALPEFYVQLAAYSSPYVKDRRFTQLPYTVSAIQEGTLYKYRTSSFQTLEAANAAKNKAKASGFTDAFVVAYLNGKRISLEEALQIRP